MSDDSPLLRVGGAQQRLLLLSGDDAVTRLPPLSDPATLRAAIAAVRASGAVDHVQARSRDEPGQPPHYGIWIVPTGGAVTDADIALIIDEPAAPVPTQPGSDEQSEMRFRTLVEYAPEAMVILDVDSGRFVDANDNACRLFGMSREQLLTSGPSEVSPARQPDGSASSLAAMSRIQDSVEGKHAVFEWTHRGAGGAEIPCEVRLVRLPHKDRRWVRGSIIDISERKRAEAERERLSLELAQAQKLQAIGQLTGGVAHDFNNLLTVIMSSVELIEAAAEATEGIRANARQALAASERAAALTQQLLAFARRQPLRPQVVNLNSLVLDAETLLRRTLGGKISIRTSLAEGLWTSETDPTQLENVILNLAINARDAMPDGGHLDIETANVHLQRSDLPEHSDLQPGEFVMLAVSDDGCGMDGAVLGQVFEPFFTTKRSGQGSGLGLSMVYGFVRQSGGHVTIDSAVDRGTSVRVYLPRSDADATAGAAAPLHDRRSPVGSVPGDARRVLVVEDDPAVRALVVQGLKNLGYRTLDTGDARRAMALLEDDDDVALLLTDVVLSGTSHGPELVRRARERWPHLPVLFMSGYTDNTLSQEGRLDQDFALLEKPFTRHELGQAVARAIAAGNRAR